MSGSVTLARTPHFGADGPASDCPEDLIMATAASLGQAQPSIERAYCGMSSIIASKVTGIRARIMTRSAAIGTSKNAASAAWIGLGKKANITTAARCWLQIGYAHNNESGRKRLQLYIEGNFSGVPGGTYHLDDLTNDKEYLFQIHRDPKIPTMWYFSIDGQMFQDSKTPSDWAPGEPVDLDFMGEDLDNSSIVGDEEKPCIFRDCCVQIDCGTWQPVDFDRDYVKIRDGHQNHIEVMSVGQFKIYSD
jgi:hypothetical protein